MDMEFVAMIVFATTLFLILVLFIVKHIEVRREQRFGESVRAAADSGALHLKHLLFTVEGYVEKTPWFLGALSRYGIHIGALAFARVARSSAEYAHNIADLVSHKHRFERKETKSQYLKRVSEYKNGDDGPVATE